MSRHDPRYDRYPGVEEIQTLANDEIDVVRDVSEVTLTASQTVHLTHRANANSILQEGLVPGNLSSGARHLVWRHGPKVTKTNDHINDLLHIGQRVLEDAKEQSGFGDPAMLPTDDTSISLWPTPELPQYLLTVDGNRDVPPSCMPEFVDDERVPYVGFVIDLDCVDMTPFFGLPHTVKRKHMDKVAEEMPNMNDGELPSREAGELPIQYWNHCVVSDSYELLDQVITDFVLPEILVESSDASELSHAETIPPNAFDAIIVPEWTDDLSNLEAPPHVPDPPTDNHAFYMTR